MTTFGNLVAGGILSVGDGYRAKNEELGDNGPIFLRSAYLQDTGWVLDTPDRLAKQPIDGFGSKVAQLGDTVLTTKGNSLGRLGLVNAAVAGSVYSPHLSYWRSLRHDELSPRYLYYWAHSAAAQNQVRARSGSTDMAPYLSLADQLSLQIELPPIEVQHGIANVLGALDDKIELNRRMVETLEAMARTLFTSWFVNFDPVRAKADGRPTGLPDDLSAIFPDCFGDHGLPKGWEPRSLPTLARFLNGLALQKHPTKDDEPFLPVIKIAEMRAGPTLKSGKATKSIPTNYHVQDGDHLFSWSGSLTHCRWTYGPGALNQHLFKVTSLEGIPDWLVYQAIEHHMPEFQAIASGKAVTMGHIQRYHLNQATIAFPPPNLLEAMNAMISPLHGRSLAAALQSRTLAGLRDTLLPKLISGGIRIADAETRIVAA